MDLQWQTKTKLKESSLGRLEMIKSLFKNVESSVLGSLQ